MKDILPKRLANRKLFERRRTLEGSIPIALAERRYERRLEVPERESSRFMRSGLLLNLSESGFAVEMPQRCRFARGEAHRLSLKVGAGTVDVDGKVRWTRSVWETGDNTDESRYAQVAGFEIMDSVTDDALSILNIMRGMVNDSKVAVEVSDAILLDRWSSPKDESKSTYARLRID